MQQAAAYVRMSTEHQKYSIDNQLAGIRAYCELNDLDLCRVYSDAGISGLTFENRPGLRSLISDAEAGPLPFQVLVVLDVSRWGRFQNVDEGAYYEHLLLRSGVRMVYCAEPFDNDDTPITTIIKSLKRAMAAEFSRELSRKVSAGKRRIASHGYRCGGCPGYGFRRVILGKDGSALRIAERGDWGAAHSGRTTLQLGPAEEVAAVRRLYRLYAVERLRMAEIASILNLEGHPPPSSDAWTSRHVGGILRNEKYCGTIVFGMVSQFLSTKRTPVDPANWVRVPNAHPAIVPQKLFRAAQIRRERSTRPWSRRDIVRGLKDLFANHGTVTRMLIDASPGLPSATRVRETFGSIQAAYVAAGLPLQSMLEKRRIMVADRAQRCGLPRSNQPSVKSLAWTVDWATVLAEAWREKRTVQEVAARTQASPKTVQNHLRRLGIELPRSAAHAQRINWEHELVRARRAGESVRELAQRLGVASSRVDQAKRRLGVELEPDGLSAQLNTEWAAELRRAQELGETPAELGRRLGLSRQVVAATAHRLGLLLRTQSVSSRNLGRGQLARLKPKT